MKSVYLEVTYRKGKPLAAYLCLPRKPGDRSARTAQPVRGLVVDYAEDGRPIGIEITGKSKPRLDVVNRILAAMHQEPISAKDLAPLLAAG